MKKLIFVLLIFILPVLAQENKEKHPIDVWLDDCLSTQEGQTTMGMVQCARDAYEKWDKELNRVYKELSKVLDTEGQKQLKETQREWIKFRDMEFKLLEDIYKNKQGSMYIPMQQLDRVDIVKKRFFELKYKLDLVVNQ